MINSSYLTVSLPLWFRNWKTGYPGLAPGYDEWM